MHHTQRFEGHWTIGAPYSEFTTNSGKAYWFSAENLPRQIQGFFDSQPSHPAADSESGREKSIYMVLDGFLTPVPPAYAEGNWTHQEIHIRKIIRFEPAHKDFIASRKDQTH